MIVRPRIALVLVGALGLCASACDKPAAPAPANEKPAEAQSAAALASGSAAPLASASAAPAAAAPTGLEGTWEGAYEAKKGAVGLPAKVIDKTWDKDDGGAASGSGTLTITIDEEGALKGRVAGALGAASLTGRGEDKTVRATVQPDDPRANAALFGVMVGLFDGEVIKAEVRVAGPDASVVREATATLHRKK